MKIVEKENILIEDEVLSKNDLIFKMIKNLNLYNIEEDIFREVLEREKIDNTVLGFGIAIPHSKSKYIDTSYIVYCKLKEKMLWEEGEEEIDKVLLILVPKDDPSKHIDILKNISTKIMRSEFREALNTAYDVDKIYELLNS